jgi:hypothetical protein
VCDADAVRSISPAAFAGRAAPSMMPDAATTTAAGRPATPAVADTARDAVLRGFVRTGVARWRAIERFLDMKLPLPMPAELAVGFGWDTRADRTIFPR